MSERVRTAGLWLWRLAACAACAACAWGAAYLLRRADGLCGRTVYTGAAFVLAWTAGTLAGLWLGVFPASLLRRRPAAAAAAAVLLAACGVWGAAALTPALEREWQRLLLDTGRTFGTVLVGLAHVALAWALLPALAAGAALRLLAAARPGGRPAPACVGWACVSMAFGLAFLGGAARPAGTGHFGRLACRDSGFAAGRPLATVVTRRHTFTAYEDADYQFLFAMDGRPLLAGSRFRSARTLSAYAPLLVRPECARALVVGPEAGWYAPFFTRAGVAEVRLGETDGTLARLAIAADAFLTGDEGGGALPPKGRASRGAAYDVIFVAPEPAWVRGAQGLYGQARLTRYREALAPAGVVALHVDARALSAERFAGVAQVFAAVFPAVQLWCTGPSDWVLVGGKAPLKTPLDRIIGLSDRRAVVRDFARAGVALPEALACRLCDGAGLAPWLAGVRPAGAWRAAWQAPRLACEGPGDAAFAPERVEACREARPSWLLPGELEVEDYLAFLDRLEKTHGARRSAVRALTETGRGRLDPGLEAARAVARVTTRDALLIPLAESLELEGRRRIAIGDLKGALRCYESLLPLVTANGPVHFGMGYCLRGTGDAENAYLHFARAVVCAPEQAGYRLELAQAALAVGEYAESDRQYREVLKRNPEHAAALFLFAKGLAHRERPDRDYPQALALAERACVLTRWENREFAYGLADLYLEAGKVMEGLGLKRRLKEGGRPSVAAGP